MISRRSRLSFGSTTPTIALEFGRECKNTIQMDRHSLVERKRLDIDPATPLVVQQWTALIAVNYVARKFGVKRGDSIKDARAKCKSLRFAHVDVIDTEGRIFPG
eukprot:987756_1